MAFNAVEGRSVQKHTNYFRIYDRYLAPFRGKRPRILEIGVQHGGSLQMWQRFFDHDVELIGVDILEQCKRFEEGNVQIYIGDQSDKSFLRELSRSIGEVDVIIDDGSHINRHQIDTFEELFYNNLKIDGFYICEDCHTSYWPRYGGGYRNAKSFIEFSKTLSDKINAWAAGSRKLPVDKATRSIRSVNFYTSVVVIEKGEMTRPQHVEAGDVKIDLEQGFKDARFSGLILLAKKSSIIQRAVRTSPFLWKVMTRILKR